MKTLFNGRFTFDACCEFTSLDWTSFLSSARRCAAPKVCKKYMVVRKEGLPRAGFAVMGVLMSKLVCCQTCHRAMGACTRSACYWRINQVTRSMLWGVTILVVTHAKQKSRMSMMFMSCKQNCARCTRACSTCLPKYEKYLNIHEAAFIPGNICVIVTFHACMLDAW